MDMVDGEVDVAADVALATLVTHWAQRLTSARDHDKRAKRGHEAMAKVEMRS